MRQLVSSPAETSPYESDLKGPRTSLYARRYIRAIPSGLLGGLLASTLELPNLLASGFRALIPWPNVLLGVSAVCSCFCLLGLLLSLSFEAVFHLFLGVASPADLSNNSDQARACRRATAIQAISGLISLSGLTQTTFILRPHTMVLFANQFASTFVLVALATVPWCLIHIATSRMLAAILRPFTSVRRIALFFGVLVLLLSWFLVHRMFGGLQHILRAVLSIEVLLLVFVFIWLNPRPLFRRLSLMVAASVLGSIILLCIMGLPQPSRFLLMKSNGWAESLLLRLPSAHNSRALDSLHRAIHDATVRSTTNVIHSLGGFRTNHPHSARARNNLPDILFITVDSLRPDWLGCYGSTRGVTPHVDRFCETASVFTNAFATAPKTTTSIFQTMAGQFEHSVRHLSLFPTGAVISSPDTVTLSSLLRDIGYRTLAQAGANLLPIFPFMGQGFHQVECADSEGHPLRTSVMLRRILQEMDQPEGQPVFCWTHIMDVHAWQRHSLNGEGIQDTYDNSVRVADEELGRFFEALSRTARGRSAIVILTADHGEALGENGLFYHGFMAPSTLRVPLLVHSPNEIPRRVATTTSHIDILPTILAQVGLDLSGFSGRDLLNTTAVPTESELTARPVFHETLLVAASTVVLETGVTQPPWQLIYDYRHDTLTLLNLATDPHGKLNLAGRSLPEEDQLLKALTAFYQVPN
jgi:hypothetical protein